MWVELPPAAMAQGGGEVVTRQVQRPRPSKPSTLSSAFTRSDRARTPSAFGYREVAGRSRLRHVGEPERCGAPPVVRDGAETILERTIVPSSDAAERLGRAAEEDRFDTDVPRSPVGPSAVGPNDRATTSSATAIAAAVRLPIVSSSLLDGQAQAGRRPGPCVGSVRVGVRTRVRVGDVREGAVERTSLASTPSPIVSAMGSWFGSTPSTTRR